MSIVTKKGDRGLTFLYWGGRVGKDNLRVEAYGTLDELCSFLGLAKSLIKERKVKELLESIQRDLFVISAEVATKVQFVRKLKKRIDKSYVARLEKNIQGLEKKLRRKGCCFVLPGENVSSSIFEILFIVLDYL